VNGTWRGTLARLIYRALLPLAPRVTRPYREDMIATFDGLSRAADREGLGATLRLLMRETASMVKAHRRAPASPFLQERTPFLASMGGWLTSWEQFGSVWRSLGRRPVFTLTVTIALALGAAVTTTLFSIVETVLLSPLPYPDADRLVGVLESNPTAPGQGTLAAPGRIEDWNRLNQTFVAISASCGDSVSDTSGDEPERLMARRVTARFFNVFAAAAQAGRVFTPEEELETGPKAVVISDAYWVPTSCSSRRYLASALWILRSRRS
jgi:MacB-like periplasmic core domain